MQHSTEKLYKAPMDLQSTLRSFPEKHVYRSFMKHLGASPGSTPKRSFVKFPDASWNTIEELCKPLHKFHRKAPPIKLSWAILEDLNQFILFCLRMDAIFFTGRFYR